MKIIEKEFNIETGEEILTERNETAAEKSYREAIEKDAAEKELLLQQKLAARAALYERLGITEEEARLLLGGN